MELHFARPLWMLIGIVICSIAFGFFLQSDRKRNRNLARFAAPHLLPVLSRHLSLRHRRLKDFLVILALACCFVALARPQYGSRWVEVRRKGIDILIAVDTSRSMLARDISPNRLERAKLAIRDFIAKLDGDRVGLLPFAGSSYLMCPLTSDYSAFTASLDALDTNIISQGGTDIAAAIAKARSVLANEANHKILILVTDGENLEGDVLAAAKEAKNEKMTIFTIGVGTPQGELIPQPDKGEGNYLRDESGKYVTSKLDEKMLATIAKTTGGISVPLGNMGEGFDAVYSRKLALVPREENGSRMRKVPIERYPLPLGTAVFLLLVDFLLPAGGSISRLPIPFFKTIGRRLSGKTPLILFFLLLGSLLQPEFGYSSQGEEFFHNQEYDKAADFYEQRIKKKADPRLLYNQGTTAYRKEEYDRAVELFGKALATEDLALQQKAYYNRGNGLYRLGEKNLKTDPQHTIELWEQALKSINSSLELNGDDDDAKYNSDLITKRLQELKEKQKKKQQEQKKEEGKEKKKDQDKKDRKNGKKKPPQEKEKKSGQPPQANKKNGENQTEKKDNREKSATKQTKPDDKKKEAQAANKDQPPAAMSKKDQQRRKEGKMTLQEANGLLDALKGDEGKLNFIPQAAGGNDEPRRNW